MNRIPVGRCIARAYGFLFGRILTVISISWVAAVFFASLRLALFRVGPIPHPIIAHWQPALLHFAGVLGGLLLFSAVAIPLTRAALGRRENWALAQFVIGAPEVRLFFAVLRIYVVMIVLVAICVAAVVGAGMGTKAVMAQWPAAAGTGLPVAAIVRDVVIALAVAVTVYVGLRISFLLYAVAAAEPHASLRRVWSLSAGNVLRILAVVVVVFVPVYALVFGAEYALMGPALIEAGRAVFASAKPDVGPITTLFIAHAQSLSIGAGVLFTVLAALGAGGSAAGYLALTDSGAAELDLVEDVEFAPAPAEPAPVEHEVHAQAEAAEPHDGAREDQGHEDQGLDAHGHEESGHDAPADVDASHVEHAVPEHAETHDLPDDGPVVHHEEAGDDPHGGHAYLDEGQAEGDAHDGGVGYHSDHAPASDGVEDDGHGHGAGDEALPPHQPAEADPSAHDDILEHAEAERLPEHA